MPDAALAGQVAIVTGAAGGIGTAVVEALVRCGAHVHMLDRDFERLEVARDQIGAVGSGIASRISIGVGDVTDTDSMEDEVGGLVAAQGRLDILVNNAGAPGPHHPLWEIPLDDWRKTFQLHVEGTVNLMRAAIPRMLGRGYGRIVNVASVAGKEGNANSSAYSAAKAAVIGLTKSAGKELARTGVTVNVVTPSVILTKMNGEVSAEYHESLLSRIPMGRLGLPSEVAEMVAFVASPACSFTTGAVFDLSGGRATY